jgi:hypothetical protein
MAQLYFLSVSSLILSGMLLSAEVLAGRFSRLEPLVELSEQRRTAIGIGAITLLVGILKIFFRAPLDSVPVAGDLLPVLAGLTAGGLLIMSQSQDRPGSVSDAARSVLVYRTAIGVGAMAVGLLHFLFPTAVIL